MKPDADTADLAEIFGRFGAVLHAAGVPVTPSSAGRLVDVIALTQPIKVQELYWLARVTLVSDRACIQAFDMVFDQVFRGILDAAGDNRNPNVPRSTKPSDRPPTKKASAEARNGESQPGMPGAPQSSDDGRSDGEVRDGVLAAASDSERLRTQAFGVCSLEELEQLRLLMTDLRLEPPMRRSRRSRVHRLGHDIDLRATLRAAGRTGGDPVRTVHRRRRQRPRRVVLIADVSGSMESYGRAYLYLLHGAVRAIGAEAFVFATRLSRLTRPLALQHPANALARAMAAAPDWSGGTRIGEALRAFNDGHARRGIGRGSIVVIVSDGWESGDVSLLARELERLSRLAHRIIWVNPRKQHAGYQPLVGGMAAAMPYVDEFLSGHSLDALREVIAAIAVDSPRRTRTRAPGAARPHVSAVEQDRAATTIPPTSMMPHYGTVISVSPERRWDVFTRPELP
jgi:uncharacterized protein